MNQWNLRRVFGIDYDILVEVRFLCICKGRLLFRPLLRALWWLLGWLALRQRRFPTTLHAGRYNKRYINRMFGVFSRWVVQGGSAPLKSNFHTVLQPLVVALHHQSALLTFTVQFLGKLLASLLDECGQVPVLLGHAVHLATEQLVHLIQLLVYYAV